MFAKQSRFQQTRRAYLYRLLKLPSLLADFVTELLWQETTKRDGELSFLPLYFSNHLIFSLPDTADSIREQ